MTLTAEAPFRRSNAIVAADYGQKRTFMGWAQEVRSLGGISFMIVRDRWGELQVTAPRKVVNPDILELINSIPRESTVKVVGMVKESRQARNGWEVIPSEVKVLSWARSPLPMGVIDRVGVEADTRFNHRYMDLRRPLVRAIFEIKSLVLKLIDQSMREQGFVEVFTPKIVAAGAEGGATLFAVDYFGRRAYLAQSPQLYKQVLMSTGMDRVFEISPAFRAEPSDTVRHVSEFISFDGEMAFIEDQRDVMKVMETLTQKVISGVIEEGAAQLELLGVELEAPSIPYPVLTYLEVLDKLSSEGKEIEEGDDIDTEGERILGEIMVSEGKEMYWIVEYPEASKPFYIMEKKDSPLSHSFDLDYMGQEISSGGQREHRYEELMSRMRKKGLRPETFEFYLNAFAYGMPPHGGWGLGVERFVQMLLHLPNIREAILFPRDRNRLVP